jgi:hypothetical protein
MAATWILAVQKRHTSPKAMACSGEMRVKGYTAFYVTWCLGFGQSILLFLVVKFWGFSGFRNRQITM